MAEASVFQSLGINPINLISQMVNIGILIFVLNKFLYKPILKKLDERSKLVKKGIEAAEHNVKLSEEMEAERIKQLQKTQKEIEKMLAKAKSDASQVKNEIIKDAQTQAEKLLVKRQGEIEQMLEKQQKELQTHVADIAVSVARKVLSEYIDEKTQANIMESQLKKLAKTKTN